MERERTRTREPEPAQASIYEEHMALYQKLKEQRAKGKVVIRGRELPWEQNRQGRIKFYSHQSNWDELVAGGWNSFIHDIRRQSGKHRHQGGTSLFVLEGKGYTVVNERRFDWEAGDLIMLPVQMGGCVHQHFNESGTESSKWISLIYGWGKLPLANEVTQREVSQDWKQTQPTGTEERIPTLEALDEDRLRVQREQAQGEWRPRTGGTLMDAFLDWRDRERQRLKTARMVIKGKEIEPEVNPMGIFYWYAHPSMPDLGSRTIVVYLQEIPPGSRSGRQLHQGGRLHYVWQGRGYTIVDGVRHDWEAGDEILLPLKFDGVVHQHFNDGDEPVKLVCAEGNLYDTLGPDLGSGFEIFEACPEYRG
jgi:quercetin dioxygenase-like cupin family protein